jgi:arabinose-5-phosphate isomerase
MKSADISELHRVLDIEAQSILDLKNQVTEEFPQALDILFKCEGKVFLTGIGKSGLIGRKIASTLSSTGTPAIFIHAAESSHGDLGMISIDDVVIALSNSGETDELSDLINYVSRKNIPLISITKNKESTLGRASKVVLRVVVKEEACPLGLAPTSSTTAALALGDALAVSLLKRRGFKSENFAEFHPGGNLTKRLVTKVKDIMYAGNTIPLVSPQTSMKEVIYKMTAAEVRGVAGVVDKSKELVGIITDGDLRRRLETANNIHADSAEDIMTLNPKIIDLNEMAEKALNIMEQFKIQSLFVVNETSKEPLNPVGIIHIQDILKNGIR